MDRRDLDYEEGRCGIRFLFPCQPRGVGEYVGFEEVPHCELQKQIAGFLHSTLRKFEDYCDCRRVLLLEGFFGRGYFVASEDVVIAVRGLKLPSHLDEVWYCDWQSFDFEEELPEYTRVL